MPTFKLWLCVNGPSISLYSEKNALCRPGKITANLLAAIGEGRKDAVKYWHGYCDV